MNGNVSHDSEDEEYKKKSYKELKLNHYNTLQRIKKISIIYKLTYNFQASLIVKLSAKD